MESSNASAGLEMDLLFAPGRGIVASLISLFAEATALSSKVLFFFFSLLSFLNGSVDFLGDKNAF